MLTLNDREKKLMIVLAVILSAGLLYFIIISPIIDLKKSSDNISAANRSRIIKLDDIYNDYKDVIAEKSKLNTVASDNRGVAAMVDEIAGSLSIAGNKVYLKENPGVVQNNIQKLVTELKFEGIQMKALLQFVEKLENSNTPLKIKSLVITSGVKERSRYDAVITIISLSKR